MDLDMALSGSQGQVVTMVSGSAQAIEHQYSPWTSTWSQATAQTTDIGMAFCDNMGHGYQHRLQLR